MCLTQPDSTVDEKWVVGPRWRFGDGARGRDVVTLPSEPAAIVQRVSRAQECTVEAALTGDRARVLDAMQLDPLTSRLDATAIESMTDAMLAATAPWLPQFA